MKIEKMKKSDLIVRLNNVAHQAAAWEHACLQAQDTVMNLRARTSSRKRFGAACGALGFAFGAFLTVLVLWLLA